MGLMDRFKRRRPLGGDDEGGQGLETEEVTSPETEDAVNAIDEALRAAEVRETRKENCGCGCWC